MLDWLRYRCQLFRLQRTKRKMVRELTDAWEKAKGETDNPVEFFAIMDAKRSSLVEPTEEDIEYLISSYLSNEAQKLRLALPNTDNGWHWSQHRRHYLLTPAAMQALRSAIRAEKKEQSELAFRCLTGFTGLIGVLIGLLAIILGRR
jgi:hypothetical protein